MTADFSRQVEETADLCFRIQCSICYDSYDLYDSKMRKHPKWYTYLEPISLIGLRLYVDTTDIEEIIYK